MQQTPGSDLDPPLRRAGVSECGCRNLAVRATSTKLPVDVCELWCRKLQHGAPKGDERVKDGKVHIAGQTGDFDFREVPRHAWTVFRFVKGTTGGDKSGGRGGEVDHALGRDSKETAARWKVSPRSPSSDMITHSRSFLSCWKRQATAHLSPSARTHPTDAQEALCPCDQLAEADLGAAQDDRHPQTAQKRQIQQPTANRFPHRGRGSAWRKLVRRGGRRNCTTMGGTQSAR